MELLLQRGESRLLRLRCFGRFARLDQVDAGVAFSSVFLHISRWRRDSDVVFGDVHAVTSRPVCRGILAADMLSRSIRPV